MTYAPQVYTPNEVAVRRAIVLAQIWGLTPGKIKRMNAAGKRGDWLTYRQVLRSPKPWPSKFTSSNASYLRTHMPSWRVGTCIVLPSVPLPSSVETATSSTRGAPHMSDPMT